MVPLNEASLTAIILTFSILGAPGYFHTLYLIMYILNTEWPSCSTYVCTVQGKVGEENCYDFSNTVMFSKQISFKEEYIKN
jgi:hypothetical protein